MDNLEIVKLKSQGYCCSQIMVKLVLDLMGRENPDLVNFSKGLCMGQGSETGDCGILTAGICIMALYVPQDQDLLASIQEQFLDTFRAWTEADTTCKGITREFYPRMHPAACGDLLARGYGELTRILVENGIDPSDPEDWDGR